MTSPKSEFTSRFKIGQALAIFPLVLYAMCAGAAPAARQPVLVELFTSEGCSDCPPADALLTRLDQQQFVAGAQAIVLSEHVTYWNHQGWRDPFSFELMDERQQQYARVFSLDSVYTPQIVVDGAEQFVGSDEAKLASAVAKEAAIGRLAIQLENAHVEPDGPVRFTVHLPADAKGTLIAAVAQDATVSQVSRGENAGRTLHHVAVVRAMKEFSTKTISEGHTLIVSGANLTSIERSGVPLRLVVFLTNGPNGKVMGAAELSLRP